MTDKPKRKTTKKSETKTTKKPSTAKKTAAPKKVKKVEQVTSPEKKAVAENPPASLLDAPAPSEEESPSSLEFEPSVVESSPGANAEDSTPESSSEVIGVAPLPEAASEEVRVYFPVTVLVDERDQFPFAAVVAGQGDVAIIVQDKAGKRVELAVGPVALNDIEVEPADADFPENITFTVEGGKKWRATRLQAKVGGSPLLRLFKDPHTVRA